MSTAPPPETRNPWAPNMVYRPRRPAAAPQTLCELYIEQQVVTFFRHYIPLGNPGFDYGPTMERATKFVNVIVRGSYAKDIEEKDLTKTGSLPIRSRLRGWLQGFSARQAYNEHPCRVSIPRPRFGWGSYHDGWRHHQRPTGCVTRREAR